MSPHKKSCPIGQLFLLGVGLCRGSLRSVLRTPSAPFHPSRTCDITKPSHNQPAQNGVIYACQVLYMLTASYTNYGIIQRLFFAPTFFFARTSRKNKSVHRQQKHRKRTNHLAKRRNICQVLLCSKRLFAQLNH